MTTENQHTDPNRAEANKPQQQDDARANQQQAESPMNILEQRLAEINAKKQSGQLTSDEGVPKEEQPEITPELASETEAENSEEITEVFAEANLPESDPVETAVTEATATTAEAPLPENDPAEEPVLLAPAPATAPPAATAATTSGTPVTEENHEEDEHEDEDATDYSQLGIGELRAMLSQLLKGPDAGKKYKKINDLHRFYDQVFQAERAEALERFKLEGGTDEDFEYHAPMEHQELEQVYSAYREARYRERQQTEEQRHSNLDRKREILQKLRELVESAETKSSSDELKKLQAEWKTIGPVPPGEAQELWDSYHALLDIFYNNRSMFFELKELDRRRNLDAKLQLIERAEALQQEPSINKALQELRHLHEEWKNIGPVPNDQRDPIWERFIQASEKVHEHRRTYMEERKTHEMANLEK
ncbi:hypothetical protein OB13_07270, partial [Pontibacter sp. HJ8]